MAMEKEEIVKHWLRGSKKNIETADDFFGVCHYDWCLFLCQLSLEKALKARIVKSGNEIPFSHDLVKLAEIAGFGIGPDEEKELNEITSYNLDTRYDDYKESFYKKATKEYAKEWLNMCKSYRKRLIEGL